MDVEHTCPSINLSLDVLVIAVRIAFEPTGPDTGAAMTSIAICQTYRVVCSQFTGFTEHF